MLHYANVTLTHIQAINSQLAELQHSCFIDSIECICDTYVSLGNSV